MLLFLKLGGSLITDKATPRALRAETLARLMDEIASARANHDVRLVLGHGSGSFGHVEGKRYGTRDGVRSEEGWRGFAEVQAAAALLNRHVIRPRCSTATSSTPRARPGCRCSTAHPRPRRSAKTVGLSRSPWSPCRLRSRTA